MNIRIRIFCIFVLVYNPGRNILRLPDVLPVFFLPQVKRCVIIRNKHGIYEKRQELPKTSDLES